MKKIVYRLIVDPKTEATLRQNRETHVRMCFAQNICSFLLKSKKTLKVAYSIQSKLAFCNA